MGSELSKIPIYLALEYAAGGSLLSLVLSLNSTTKVTEPLAAFWFRQILEGVQYMHDKGYAHLDLKHDNILLDSNLNIKISDFGFTTKMRDGGLVDLKKCT